MTFFVDSGIYKVDQKGRVNIPSRYTNQLIEKPGDTAEGLIFYATKYSFSDGKFKWINLLLPDIFKNLAAKMKEECGPILNPNKNIKAYNRLMASAKECRCDRQGRIIIPRKHLDYAHITYEVMIVGSDDVIQLWNPELFEEHIVEPDILE